MATLGKTKEYSNIRDSLVTQMKTIVGKNIPAYYMNMIDNYMSLWKATKELQKDIDLRGVTVEYNNGGGQSGVKKNESVYELNKTIKQMLQLLDALGINPSKVSDGPDGYEL